MTGAPDPDCLFCRVVAGEIPATIAHRDEDFVAFADINPQAPVHLLLIPTRHYPNAAALGSTEPGLAGRMLEAAGQVAAEAGLDGYRLVFNTGTSAGQSVFHVHAHVLGGRALAWPPG